MFKNINYKKLKYFLLVIILLSAIFLLIFFSEKNSVERKCKSICKYDEQDYLKHQVSKTYDFVKCFCDSEGKEVYSYFDLRDYHKLTESQVLKRIMG